MATQMTPKEATDYLRNLRRLPGWEEGEAIMIPTREMAPATATADLYVVVAGACGHSSASHPTKK